MIKFDVALPATIRENHIEEQICIVIHRGPLGDVLLAHTPLTDGALRCRVCDDGAKIYVE